MNFKILNDAPNTLEPIVLLISSFIIKIKIFQFQVFVKLKNAAQALQINLHVGLKIIHA